MAGAQAKKGRSGGIGMRLGGSVLGGLAGAVAILILFGTPVAAHDPSAAPDFAETDPAQEAIQFLADLTVIDGTCRELAVNFGIAFQFASGRGLTVESVMPTGSKRQLFEHDLQATRSQFDAEVICGDLARHYALVVPGSVTFPYELRGHNS